MVPRLIEHQITLRFRMPVESVQTAKKETLVLDDVIRLADWTYIDRYGIECSRFEMYSPDFDSGTEADGVPEGESMWVLTFGSTSEIPLEPRNRRDESQMDALTIVEQIKTIVAKHFPELVYVRSEQYKKFEISEHTALEF